MDIKLCIKRSVKKHDGLIWIYHYKRFLYGDVLNMVTEAMPRLWRRLIDGKYYIKQLRRVREKQLLISIAPKSPVGSLSKLPSAEGMVALFLSSEHCLWFWVVLLRQPQCWWRAFGNWIKYVWKEHSHGYHGPCWRNPFALQVLIPFRNESAQDQGHSEQ